MNGGLLIVIPQGPLSLGEVGQSLGFCLEVSRVELLFRLSLGDPARSKVGSPDDVVSKGKPEDSSKERGATGSFPPGKEPAKRRVRFEGGDPLGLVPKKAAPAQAPEDDPDLHEYAPSEPGELLPEQEGRELFPSQEDVPDVSSLEPRRIALSLPGHEVSPASPQYKRMLEN